MTLSIAFTDGVTISFGNVSEYSFDIEDDTFVMIGNQEDVTIIPREQIRFVSERPE